MWLPAFPLRAGFSPRSDLCCPVHLSVPRKFYVGMLPYLFSDSIEFALDRPMLDALGVSRIVHWEAHSPTDSPPGLPWTDKARARAEEP